MNRTRLLTFAAIIVLCGGCNIFPEIKKTKVNYFEIGFDEKDKSQPKENYRIIVNRVEAEGPYYQRMVFKTSENSVDFDEYNRWSQSPSKMLKNYLKLALNNPDMNVPEERQFILNANILRFDSDLEDNTSNLVLEVDIKRKSDDACVLNKIFVEKVKVEKNKAVFYVEGMKKAVSNVAEAIRKKMSSVK